MGKVTPLGNVHYIDDEGKARQGELLPHIRTSERKDFKRCQQRWWWAWRMGLKSIDQKNALWFGTGMHEALAEYYQLGYKRHPTQALEVWDAYCEGETRIIRAMGLEIDGPDDKHRAVELGRGMLEGYFEKYQGDKELDIIQVERPFEILVPDPHTPTADVAIYNGTYDGVFRHKRLKTFNILEHKTAKAITLEHLSLDEQAGSYLWVATAEMRAAGLLKRTESINSILYNFLRKALPDDRPRNKDGLALNQNGSISKSQPPPFFVRETVRRARSASAVMARRVADEVEQMNALRSGQLSVLKTPTHDCRWDCSFFDLCELHEDGSDYEEFQRALFRVEDPYADHRKSTDG